MEVPHGASIFFCVLQYILPLEHLYQSPYYSFVKAKNQSIFFVFYAVFQYFMYIVCFFMLTI